MNKNKIVKKLMLLALVLFTTVLLTACGTNKDAFPTGSLDDSVYVSAGSHQVTKKELYNEFRFDGLNILQTLVDQKVFAEYYAKVDYNNEDHRLYIEEAINTAVFGSADIEVLQEKYEDDDVRRPKVLQFVDNLVIVGKILPTQKDGLVTELMTTATFDGYSNTFLDLYKQRMAIKIFAQEKLDVELEDKDSDQFIEDSEVVKYYKNNRKGRYNVSAFWTEFLNLNEQRAAFRKLSIKISSAGKWFQVPNIAIIDSNEEGYIDVEDSAYKHVKDILVNKKIKYEDESGNRVEISKEDFQKYYDAYSFDENRTGLGADIAFTAEQVLDYMVKAHNLTHSQQLEVIDASTGEIKVVVTDEFGNKTYSDFNTEFEYDDFTNTSLRTHIYTALKVPTDDSSTDVQYSQRANTFGDYVYLVYKFGDDANTEEGVLNEDEDEFLEGNDELITELKTEIAEKRLTDTYINGKVTEFKNEHKLNLYDPVLRMLFERSNEYRGATKMKDNDILAEMGDHVVTVDEFYVEAEKSFGISLASDLLTNKILRDDYYSEITADEHKSNDEQMKNMLTAFAQNQYESSGYPASIGKDNFLLLAFRALSVDEAIDKAFVLPKVNELYTADLENQYDDIYEKFATVSAQIYQSYWSLNASHLLIYLDRDLDGTPDNPNELPEDELAEAHRLLPLFIAEIFERIGKETTEQRGLDRLIADFNDSTRLPSEDEYDKEHLWAEFKRFGFRLKQETLGEITNSSNFLTSSSRLDEVFYNRAKALREIVKDYTTAQFPFLDFFTGDVSFDPDNGHIEEIQTAFGWHIIMATGVGEMASAKLDVDENNETHLSEITDSDGNKLSGVNEEDIVNATQIEIYLKELASEYAVQIKVVSALQAQFGQVKSRYESNQMKSEIVYRLLVNNGLTFTSNDNQTKFNTMREINQNQMFNYLIGQDPAFDALWGNWFEIFQ